MPDVSISYDNIEIEEVGVMTLEDWKLPPSIEDEEAISGGKSLDAILEEARGARGEVSLYVLI